MKIEVLGAGCPSCQKMFDLVKSVVQELGLSVEVQYESDVQKIVALGLMQSPVLVIDGQPVLVGFSDDRAKITKLIMDKKR